MPSPKTDQSGPSILVVDDEEVNVALLHALLERAGYTNVRSTVDARRALDLFREQRPDLVLLDLHMPFKDGVTVMTEMLSLLSGAEYLPVVILTADTTNESKKRALAAGATDFLTKPFDPTEVMLRAKNLLQTRSLHLELQNENLRLDKKVRDRTLELEEAQLEILDRLARAAEYRDDQTRHHTRRVGQTAGLIARELGLVERRVDLIRVTAPLHDVGKIAIPDSILLKPGKLTPDEMEVVQRHVTVGAALLADGHSELVRVAERIARTHHARWDGNGYPKGLAGEDIPIEGRIVAVADVFDALIHERPYKRAWSAEEAVEEITRQSGKQFDPKMVAAFRHVFESEDIVRIGEDVPRMTPHAFMRAARQHAS